MTTYTKISKASGTSYTKLSPPGTARYGYGKYGTAKYDDNGGSYTKLSKPTATINSFSVYPTTANRNNFGGCCGFQFQVSSSVTIYNLGRLYVTGNTHNHVVNFWDSSNQATPLATGNILASSPSDANGFKYVKITPTTLTANHTYAIAIDESVSGDSWLDIWTPTLQSLFSVTASYNLSHSNYPGTLVSANMIYNTCAIIYGGSGATFYFTIPKAT